MKEYDWEKLNESFFDDLESEDDIRNQISQDVTTIIDQKHIKNIEIILNSIQILNKNRYQSSVKFIYENNIGYVIYKPEETYYYQKEWSIAQLKCNSDFKTDVQLFQSLFDELYSIQCERLVCNLAITPKLNKSVDSEDLINPEEYYELNFNNIALFGISMSLITPKNLHIDCPLDLLRNMSEKYGNMTYIKNAYIKRCNLKYQDTFTFKNNNTAGIHYCYNMKDYSFLNKCTLNVLNLSYKCQKHIPECRNFSGLPNLNMQLAVTYGKNDSNDSYYFDSNKDFPNYTGINTYVGIPANLNSLDIISYNHPTMVLPYISFEGIPGNFMMSDQFKVRIYGFSTRTPIIVQVGPIIKEFKVKVFKFVKPMLKYMAESGDYYMDCYYLEKGPNKTYNPENSVSNDKVFKSAKLKSENENEKKAERIEDYNKMVELAKKVLEPDVIYTQLLDQSKKSLHVLSIGNDGIRIKPKNRTYFGRDIYYEWTKLFKVLTDYPFMRKTASDPTLYDQIIKRVQDERKKLNKKKIAAKKKVKDEEKVQDNTEQTIQTITNVKEKEIISKIKEIDVVDYSEKALAVFGKTYYIKDQLKEIGAKFNRNLKCGDNDFAPGWVVPKSKKEQLDKILNSYQN